MKALSLRDLFERQYIMSFEINQFPLFTTDELPEQQRAVLQPVVEMLNSEKIDKQLLMRYLRLDIFKCVPLLREYVWKVILRYLPTDKSKWEGQVIKQEAFYNGYLRQFLFHQIEPSDSHQYQKDNNLWVKIEKDTYRTQPGLPFFKEQVKSIDLLFQSLPHENQVQKRVTRRYHYMTRILFIFAKLNPLIGYVQGMNQILAPIFYVANQGSGNQIQEAACFLMFTNVMTDIIPFHIKDFDNSQSKFQQRMSVISNMVNIVDTPTWQRLELLEIDPFLYLFRWITLLFAQEFPIPQTLRIWDIIFSYQNRTQFVDAFALALIMSCRHRIAVGSFTEVLSHFRNISDHIKLEEVIIQARQYCESDPQRWNGSIQEDKIEKEGCLSQEQNWMPGFFKYFG